MAAGARRITIEVLGDASGLRQAFGDATKATDTFADRVRGVGERMRGVGAVLSAGVTAPLALLGKESLDVASEVARASTIIEGTLGQTAAELTAQTAGLREQWALSKPVVAAASAEFGLLTDQLALTDAEQQRLNGRLVEVVGIWQALKGVDPAQTVQMVSAATRGEYDSLQQLIPSISAARVEEEALAVARADGRTQAGELDKTTAALNIVVDESARKAGLATDALEGEAGAVATQRQALEDLQLTIGQKLLPLKERLLHLVGRVLDVFNRLPPSVQTLGLAFVGVAAVAGPFLLFAGQLLVAVPALATTVTATLVPAIGRLATALWALSTNPAVLAAAAIALLVAGLVVAYQESETFRRAVDLVADVMQVGLAVAAKAALVVLQQLSQGVMLAAEAFLTLAAAAVGWTSPTALALRGAREDIARTRVAWNDEISGMIKEVDVFAQAHIAQALNALDTLTYRVNLLDGRTVTIRTRADTGNILTGARPYQRGGRIRAGQAGLVGEGGPELFVPDRAGTILPRPPRPRAAGPAVVNYFTFPRYVGSRDELVAEVQRGLRDYQRANGRVGF